MPGGDDSVVSPACHFPLRPRKRRGLAVFDPGGPPPVNDKAWNPEVSYHAAHDLEARKDHAIPHLGRADIELEYDGVQLAAHVHGWRDHLLVRSRSPSGRGKVRLEGELAASEINTGEMWVLGGLLPAQVEAVRIRYRVEPSFYARTGGGGWIAALKPRKTATEMTVQFLGHGREAGRQRFKIDELLPPGWTAYGPLESYSPRNER